MAGPIDKNGVPKHLDLLTWWLENGRNLKLVAKHFNRSYATVKVMARSEDWQGYLNRQSQKVIENHFDYKRRYYEVLDVLADKVKAYIESMEIADNDEAIALMRLLQADVTSSRTQTLEVKSTGSGLADIVARDPELFALGQELYRRAVEDKSGDDGGASHEK